MHESWTTSIANMTYTRSQNYTNIVIGEHRVQKHSKLWLLCYCHLMFLSLQVHILLYFWTSGLPKYT